MLGHAIVLIGINVAFEAIKTSSALQISDISRFIAKLKLNDENYNNARNDRAYVDENKGYITISSQELNELIDRVAHDVYNQDRNVYKDRTRNKKRSIKYGDLDKLYLELLNLEQFLFSNPQRGKRKPNKAVLSNRAEKSIDLGFDSGQTFNDEYNKLYMVHNPRANLNENDFNNIIRLLSRHLVSGSASKKIFSKQDDTTMRKEPRYKGFVIADGRRARSRIRDSKEIRPQADSLEDYKPKRVRSDYGGAGGRTPIPYIRHRDIYERE